MGRILLLQASGKEEYEGQTDDILNQLAGLTKDDLLNAFTRILPGLGETVIEAITPVILNHLGRLVAANIADQEIINLLTHLMEPAARRREETIEDTITQIKNELGLISSDWKIRLDPKGNYYDIVGTPTFPTSTSLLKEKLKPKYDEVTIATVYLDEPRNEMATNALFIATAPQRIKKLIEIIEGH